MGEGVKGGLQKRGGGADKEERGRGIWRGGERGGLQKGGKREMRACLVQFDVITVIFHNCCYCYFNDHVSPYQSFPYHYCCYCPYWYNSNKFVILVVVIVDIIIIIL